LCIADRPAGREFEREDEFTGLSMMNDLTSRRCDVLVRTVGTVPGGWTLRKGFMENVALMRIRLTVRTNPYSRQWCVWERGKWGVQRPRLTFPR